MKTKILFITFCVFVFTASGQVPVPAETQTERIVLFGATAHIGNGNIIENSALCFENGKILWIRDASTIRLDRTTARIIDISGKHVYPGFISPNTELGLIEIDAVRSTNDKSETGGFNPNVRTAIAYNTDSRIIPTVRSNGILIAQVAPRGGRISGSSSIMQLDAWNWEDALIKEDDGVFVNWPSFYHYKGWWGEPGGFEKNKKYKEQLSELYTFFRESKSYCVENNTGEKSNLKFEAMCPVFSGNKKIFIRTNYVKSILAAIEFSEELSIPIVILGARDSWMIAEDLAAKNIPVILGQIHQLPGFDESDIDQAYKTPKILQDAGVLFSLSIGKSWQERNLVFMAGTAAAYGLTKEEALASISYNTAKILGVESLLGSLEEGKDATIIVSSGDVLDMKESNIEMAYIQGREIDLNNKQKDLHKKFSKKYSR